MIPFIPPNRSKKWHHFRASAGPIGRLEVCDANPNSHHLGPALSRLGPAIHDLKPLECCKKKTWMPGPSPGKAVLDTSLEGSCAGRRGRRRPRTRPETRAAVGLRPDRLPPPAVVEVP